METGLSSYHFGSILSLLCSMFGGGAPPFERGPFSMSPGNIFEFLLSTQSMRFRKSGHLWQKHLEKVLKNTRTSNLGGWVSSQRAKVAACEAGARHGPGWQSCRIMKKT